MSPAGCPPDETNAFVAAARDAQARVEADAAREGDTTYWGRIQLANGDTVVKTTKWASCVADWRGHSRNVLLEHGTGEPPTEVAPSGATSTPGPAPEAPPTSPAAETGLPGVVPAPSSEGAAETYPIDEPPCPLLAEPASAAARPAPIAAGAAAPVGPDEVIEQVLEHLVEHEDLRIASAAKRIRRYLAERAAGVYCPPRFTRRSLGPAGF